MIKKEINHYPKEVCGITRQEIDTEKDNYCIVIDCKGSEVMKVGFYKNEAYRDMIQTGSKKSIKETMGKYQKWAGQLVNNVQRQFGNKQDEEVVIK